LTICSLSESDGPSESHLASKEKPQPTPDTQHRKKFDSISYGSGMSAQSARDLVEKILAALASGEVEHGKTAHHAAVD
jgi:hypothetical protein